MYIYMHTCIHAHTRTQTHTGSAKKSHGRAERRMQYRGHRRPCGSSQRKRSGTSSPRRRCLTCVCSVCRIIARRPEQVRDRPETPMKEQQQRCLTRMRWHMYVCSGSPIVQQDLPAIPRACMCSCGGVSMRRVYIQTRNTPIGTHAGVGVPGGGAAAACATEVARRSRGQGCCQAAAAGGEACTPRSRAARPRTASGPQPGVYMRRRGRGAGVRGSACTPRAARGQVTQKGAVAVTHEPYCR